MDKQEEDTSLAKRILRDLRIIFDRETNLIEFDIIPMEDKVLNKSPVIVEDHRLGLESWAIKYLYTYTYNEFMKVRSHGARSDSATIHELTRCILLLNPDMRTAWNCRKQLVIDNYLTVADELKLSALIAKRRRKCLENFSHRQWLLQLMAKTQGHPDVNFINSELDLCSEAARRYQSNYYAWDYRRWVIQSFASNLFTCMNEMTTTKTWIERHISDYSGFSYRQFLIVLIGQLFVKVKDASIAYDDYGVLLVNEMEFINDLLRIHCHRESIFLHRRFVITQLLSIDKSSEQELFEKERNLVIQYTKQGRDKILIERHIKWCHRTLHWDFM